jgi:hypothetical protein
MMTEQRGKLLIARAKIREVIKDYDQHRYLSSWEDQQVQKLREAGVLIDQVVYEPKREN